MTPEPAQLAQSPEARASEFANLLDPAEIYSVVRKRMLNDMTGTDYDTHLVREVAHRAYRAATTARPTERGAVEGHFARMQDMMRRYVEPATYVASFPKDSSKWESEFPEPEAGQSEVAHANRRTRRDQAFIADMIHMMDGPEQRALAQPATDQAAEEREGCVGTMDAARAIYFLERFKREEKWLGPHEQWALDFTITALDTQTATGRTMGGEDKQAVADLHALQHDGTTLAAKPTWGGSIIRWAVDEIKGLRAALQNGGER